MFAVDLTRCDEHMDTRVYRIYNTGPSNQQDSKIGGIQVSRVEYSDVNDSSLYAAAGCVTRCYLWWWSVQQQGREMTITFVLHLAVYICIFS